MLEAGALSQSSPTSRFKESCPVLNSIVLHVCVKHYVDCARLLFNVDTPEITTETESISREVELDTMLIKQDP